jgi:hypothetical protein
MMNEGGFRSPPGMISPEQRKKAAEVREERRRARAAGPRRSLDEEAARLEDPAAFERHAGNDTGVPDTERTEMEAFADRMPDDAERSPSGRRATGVQGASPDLAPETLRSEGASTFRSATREPAVSVEFSAPWSRGASPRSVDRGRHLLPNPFSDGNDVATQEAVAWMDRGHREIQEETERRRWDAYHRNEPDGDEPDDTPPTLRSPLGIPPARDTDEDAAAAWRWDAAWEDGEDADSQRRTG